MFVEVADVPLHCGFVPHLRLTRAARWNGVEELMGVSCDALWAQPHNRCNITRRAGVYVL